MDESEIVERVIHAYRLKQYGKQISESADKVSAAAAKIPLDGGRWTGARWTGTERTRPTSRTS
jgi:hypothetical protein